MTTKLLSASECGLFAGTKITYRDKQAIAKRIDGNLCWTDYQDGTDIAPFIWRFADGTLNNLHFWDGKPAMEVTA